MTDAADRLFARGEATPGGFRFDADVARVFADMISRSVPGYAEAVAMTGWLAGRLCREDTHLYDLGCSLGATLFACQRATEGRGLRYVGVDASAPMLERCAAQLEALGAADTVTLMEQDIRRITFEPASFVALNWTLQFVPMEDRLPLLTRIRAALAGGGGLVLSEKIVEEMPAEQALLDGLHLDFKRAQGYSELEIAAKRTAIEDVLMPETLAAHRTRLAAAGFTRIILVARSLNFATLLACP